MRQQPQFEHSGAQVVDLVARRRNEWGQDFWFANAETMESGFEHGEGLTEAAAILVQFSDDLHAFCLAFGFSPIAVLRGETKAMANIRDKIADAGDNTFSAELETAGHERADSNKNGEVRMSTEAAE